MAGVRGDCGYCPRSADSNDFSFEFFRRMCAGATPFVAHAKLEGFHAVISYTVLFSCNRMRVVETAAPGGQPRGRRGGEVGRQVPQTHQDPVFSGSPQEYVVASSQTTDGHPPSAAFVLESRRTLHLPPRRVGETLSCDGSVGLHSNPLDQSAFSLRRAHSQRRHSGRS